MNAYADVTTLKSASFMNKSDTDEDAQLRKMLEMASRQIDKYCRRHFYTYEETRYYPGAGDTLMIPDDILSISSLKTDDDGDGTFENTFTTTDYTLFPLNGFPKLWVELSDNPDFSHFAAGIRKGVEVVGVFGYGDGLSATPFMDSGDTVQDDPLSSSATTLNVSSGGNFAIGQTLRIESEQAYITAISANALTIKRGMNGTTAASHAQDTAISIYEYPIDITQVCLITVMRAYERNKSRYQDMVAIPEMGTFALSKGIDPDVKSLLAGYVKLRFA
jgi:hypothetical protein